MRGGEGGERGGGGRGVSRGERGVRGGGGRGVRGFNIQHFFYELEYMLEF